MTADEYWFGDPALLYNYDNAFNLKQKYDTQMAWVQGAYFKSALGSTQVWTAQPMKAQDWHKMPEYAKMPFEDGLKKKEVSPEKQKLIDETREKLSALGLLRQK